MKRLMLIASMAAVTTGFAVPTVKTGSVTLAQDPNTRVVTVNYTLENEAGVVTVDFQTNGVSIGYANINYLAGDVNKKVATGNRSFTWRPDKSWPGHRIDSASVTAVVTAWSVTAPPDYMVVDLSGSKAHRYYPAAEAVPFGVSNRIYKTDYLLMRKIPAANVTWRMGSPSGETGHPGNANAHQVTLTSDFYIGVYQLTQRQYENVVGAKPSYYKNVSCYQLRPVESVSPVAFRGQLTWPVGGHDEVTKDSPLDMFRAKSGINSLDLPLEAAWEFACRAGRGEIFYTGDVITDGAATTSPVLDKLARYQGNSGVDPANLWNSTLTPQCDTKTMTAEVGSYAPNAWGLYDMCGNVQEWCLDLYAYTLTGSVDPAKGPTADDKGKPGTDAECRRVVRGGSFMHAVAATTSPSRDVDAAKNKSSLRGFRLVCDAVAP